MPERAADKRNQRYQELQGLLDQQAKELRENDWAERLVANSDFQRACQEIRKDLETQYAKIAALKKDFFTRPMTEAAAGELRQQVMMWEIRLTSLEKFVNFPKMWSERLKLIRKAAPELQRELKELEKRRD